MGFFVGFRYFDTNNPYDWELVHERRLYQDEQKRRREIQDDKRRRKEQAKAREAQNKKKEEWRKEADSNMREAEKRFSQHNLGNGLEDYDKFHPGNKDAYRDEIEQRFGANNLGQETKTPKINRGLGAGHHMKVKANDNKHARHSPIGPIGAPIKRPPGMDKFGMNVDTPPTKFKGGGNSNIGESRRPAPSENNSGGKPGGGGDAPALFNPFGGGGGNGSKLFRF